MKNQVFLVSLCEFLVGSYLKVVAEDEILVRLWANQNLKGLWCSVYKPEDIPNALIVGKTVTLTSGTADGDDRIFANYSL